jgi:hypothetical protein
VERRVGLRLANGASMLHGAILFFPANSVFSLRSVWEDFTPRSQRSQKQSKRYLRRKSIAHLEVRITIPRWMRAALVRIDQLWGAIGVSS